ncbi:MAG: hypothetical protein IJE43_11050 [Alphaproteobacteria bacterium]|nr:hypothetical protein [Alphaproteobacteria bacterium]
MVNIYAKKYIYETNIYLPFENIMDIGASQFSQKDATLKIYPLSIEPRADLPNDMKNVYHFGVI